MNCCPDRVLASCQGACGAELDGLSLPVECSNDVGPRHRDRSGSLKVF
jgi:hypothetical protein